MAESLNEGIKGQSYPEESSGLKDEFAVAKTVPVLKKA